MKTKYWIYLIIILLVTLWSGYQPYEGILWILEAMFCVIGVGILVFTFKRFRFTDLTYTFIVIHIIILMVGAHYSYARVPLFDWISELFDWERNNYDKVGHFAQGFIPAMIARELMIRKNVFNKRSWLPFVVVCICMAISAFYEFIEWWGALLIKTTADDFLGMQGYEWDTQSDMFMCMLGAISMLIFFSKWQDKQIKKIKE